MEAPLSHYAGGQFKDPRGPDMLRTIQPMRARS